MRKRISISEGVIVSFVIFVLAAFFIKGPGPNNQIETLLSVSSFLFSIFVAFSIANNHSRYNQLTMTLKEHDGAMLFLYQISTVLSSVYLIII